MIADAGRIRRMKGRLGHSGQGLASGYKSSVPLATLIDTCKHR
jgi:hypothetical protein